MDYAIFFGLNIIIADGSIFSPPASEPCGQRFSIVSTSIKIILTWCYKFQITLSNKLKAFL